MAVTTEKRDYYQVLGLARGADEKDIKDAFRRLAMKYHPDRNKEAGAEERFKEIAEAYAVLSDPAKRKEYDNAGFAGVADFSRDDLFGGIRFEDVFSGNDFDFGNFGLFDRIFRRAGSGPPRGADVMVDLYVSLRRVASGGEEKLNLKRRSPCTACGGNGAESGTARHACATCQGSGKIRSSQKKGKNTAEVLIQQISVCPNCAGSGQIIDRPCRVCAGNGQTWVEESLLVNIPVGVEDDMRLRIAGHGEASQASGGPPGDLLVQVHSANDPDFVRHGADLWHSATISVPDAVLGRELSIPTLDGAASVKIVPGTQPESTLRLRGKGLPRFAAAGRGDLYLRVHVRVPEQLSKAERQLYERLRGLSPL